MKPLIDRMAEALEQASPIVRRDLLAEYRNRPPEISQDAARALLRACNLLLEPLGQDEIEECWQYQEAQNAIARAEAELKGR